MDPMLLVCSHVEFLRSTLRSDRHGNAARVVAAAQLEPVNMAGVRPPHVYGLFVPLLRGGGRLYCVGSKQERRLNVTCNSQCSAE